MKAENRAKYLRGGLDLLLYLTILVPLLFSILGYIELELGSFNCKDPTIQLHNRGNTVSRKLIVILIFIPILFLIFVTELFHVPRTGLRTRLREAGRRTGVMYVRYWVASTINILANDVLKVLSAVPRPDFIESCKPDWNRINCTENGGTVMFRRDLCLSEDTAKVLDSMKSWPSGHAQLTAFSAVFMIVYIERRIGEKNSVLWKRWLQILLCIVPLYCAATRIQDHRHHVSDVVVGLGLGALLGALFSWNLIPHSWTSSTKAVVDSPEERVKRPSRMHLLSNDFHSRFDRDKEEKDRELAEVNPV